MAYDSEKDDYGANEVHNLRKFVRIHKLVELLSQIPEEYYVATNPLGNLVILKGPDLEYVGYIDLGSEMVDLFTNDVS
jgi:hypothetical protein